MNFNLCHKILTAEQIRQADQFTIKNEPIASIDLMERASMAFVDRFVELYQNDSHVYIFCGTGNNGGDGLVISRLLINKGYKVEVFVIGDPEKDTKDFKLNHDIVQNYTSPFYIKSEKDFPLLTKHIVVVDAIFGSGLSRGIEGVYGELINHVNQSACDNVVAVDIASGLGCNEIYSDGAVIEVSETITFQVPKLSHVLPQNEAYSGGVSIVDIGLDQAYIDSVSSNYFLTTPVFIKSIFKPRNKFSHKGSAGRNLIIAGSYGKMGAAVLSAKACLRAGAGLLTAYLPKCGLDIMQSGFPEAMVKTGKGELQIEDIPELSSYDAIGVGPGIGTDETTKAAIRKLIKDSTKPLVIDADAINILSENQELLKDLPEASILTPHPGEFKRLVGDWKNDYERLEFQIAFAKKYKVVVVLKGAHTSIASPDGVVFFNSTGNPGMATAGSGDVLTGVITSFLGQGYPSLEAALLGVYLHGLSADIYIKNNGQAGLIASDIIEGLPVTFFTIEK